MRWRQWRVWRRFLLGDAEAGEGVADRVRGRLGSLANVGLEVDLVEPVLKDVLLVHLFMDFNLSDT